MKKLGLIALLCCLASCEYKTEIKDVRNTEQNIFNNIYHFKYKSHDYIMFRTKYTNNGVAGVVHDPDCKCKEDEE